MTKPLTAAMLAMLSSCTYYTIPLTEQPVPGLRPEYVCLRRHADGTCVRSQWRCTAPATLTHADVGRPRCVMPGSE